MDIKKASQIRNRQDIIKVFKMYRGYSSIALNVLFVVDKNDKGTRSHSCNLNKARCTSDIVKFFFSNTVQL